MKPFQGGIRCRHASCTKRFIKSSDFTRHRCCQQGKGFLTVQKQRNAGFEVICRPMPTLDQLLERRRPEMGRFVARGAEITASKPPNDF